MRGLCEHVRSPCFAEISLARPSLSAVSEGNIWRNEHWVQDQMRSRAGQVGGMERGWKRGEGDTTQIHTSGEENVKGNRSPAWALCVQPCVCGCEILETTKVAQYMWLKALHFTGHTGFHIRYPYYRLIRTHFVTFPSCCNLLEWLSSCMTSLKHKAWRQGETASSALFKVQICE